MLTNFSQEIEHVNKGKTIAYIEEIEKTSHEVAFSDSAAFTPKTIVPEPDFDINPSLSLSQQQMLRNLLRR